MEKIEISKSEYAMLKRFENVFNDLECEFDYYQMAIKNLGLEEEVFQEVVKLKKKCCFSW